MLLILGGMSSGSRRYGLHAWRFFFQFGRALLRINREHSLREADVLATLPMCKTPGCWHRGIAGVMDLFSAICDDLQVDGRLASYLNSSRHQCVVPVGVEPPRKVSTV